MTLNNSKYQQNKEISWIQCSGRLLDEARDKSVPTIERLNYVADFMNKIDAYLKFQPEYLNETSELIQDMMDKKDSAHILIDLDLELAGVEKAGMLDLLPEYHELVDKIYNEEIKGHLKSYVVSENEELPIPGEVKTCLIAKLACESTIQYGLIDIPQFVPQIYILNNGLPYISTRKEDDLGIVRRNKRNFTQPCTYILTEDIIKMHAEEVFESYELLELHEIRLYLGKNRENAAVIVDGEFSVELRKYLLSTFSVHDEHTFRTNHIDYSYVDYLRNELPVWLSEGLCWDKYISINQIQLDCESVIDRVQESDLLLCYPYDSMDPVFRLLDECAIDERVSEIRISLHQNGSNSTIINRLIELSSKGKHVTVLMNEDVHYDYLLNKDWTCELILNGAKVVYAECPFKLHTSMLQIVIDEAGEPSYITCFTTGDFVNNNSEKQTDFALLSSDIEIGNSADIFWEDILNGEISTYSKLLTSPYDLKRMLLHLVRLESERGQEGRIFIKVNELSDPDIVEELKNASINGCNIRLIVSGSCCLLPGVEGLTENIDVVNIVSRYSEHSRVYLFGNTDHEVMLISSADLTRSSLEDSIEYACPILIPELKKRIKAILYLNYVDNVKGKQLCSDGIYRRRFISDKKLNSQEMLMG